MLIQEITEGVTTVFGRKGNRTVRKYRCTSGSRKGRIVAKPSTCTAPRNAKRSQKMKFTRSKNKSKMSVSANRSKRSNPASLRLKTMNTGMRRIKPKRKSGRRKNI